MVGQVVLDVYLLLVLLDVIRLQIVPLQLVQNHHNPHRRRPVCRPGSYAIRCSRGRRRWIRARVPPPVNSSNVTVRLRLQRETERETEREIKKPRGEEKVKIEVALLGNVVVRRPRVQLRRPRGQIRRPHAQDHTRADDEAVHPWVTLGCKLEIVVDEAQQLLAEHAVAARWWVEGRGGAMVGRKAMAALW